MCIRDSFHFMNTTAAVAVCCTAGLPLEKAIAAAGTFEVSRERYDEFNVDGRKAILMPVSYTHLDVYKRQFIQ